MIKFNTTGENVFFVINACNQFSCALTINLVLYTNIQIVLLVLYFFLKIQRFEIILLDFEIHVFLKRFKFFIDCFYLFIRIFCFLYTISNKKYLHPDFFKFYETFMQFYKAILFINIVLE